MEKLLYYFIFFVIGVNAFGAVCQKTMAIGDNWEGVFAIFASGSVTCSLYMFLRARLVHRRLRKALKSGVGDEELCTILRKAGFHPTPSDPEPSGLEAVPGLLAYVPASICLSVLLRPLLGSAFWRGLISLLCAIPVALILAIGVNCLVASRESFRRAKRAITDHDPTRWNAMERKWAEGKEAMAEAAASSAKAEDEKKDRKKRERELIMEWFEISKSKEDPKSLAWVASCHLLHAEKVNIHRTVKHVLGGGEVYSCMTWEASKAKAVEFAREALAHCKEEGGEAFCRSLLARAELLELPTVPMEESEGMSHAVGILQTHHEVAPEQLAMLAGKQTLDDLSLVVSSLPGSEWLIGFGGLSRVCSKSGNGSCTGEGSHQEKSPGLGRDS